MLSKEEAYVKIESLVERFHEQLPSYKKGDYNETQTRLDYINPFFKALGWDVDNSMGNAEAYREVIHEDKVKIGGATKAPDYSFRLPGGKRLFFVEAKKPSVVVKDDVGPAYQVRRYGWNAKLPISLITDFEEFAVYDCTKKPSQSDKASKARVKYLTYKQYLDEFDFIWNTFSKPSVLKGSFDKFVVSDTNKKGTATVDKEFLASLDEWRIMLAQNIALRNQQLNEDELNFVVQQTLDRIIFLRIAEDRSVEPYGELKKITDARKEEGAYFKSLFQLFKDADSKYNSGLFDFKKDTLSKDITIDNKVIKTIVSELYYPNCPYEFSVLGVEIMGSAYEQFLGKQIRLSAGHKAIIEEKPEVRKAGGVYYTPEYIVDYIVENTVGKKIKELEKQKPTKVLEEVAKLKIVDPACGSGSFLIGAYSYLLNWHLEHYKPEFERLTAILRGEHNMKTRDKAVKDRNKLPLTPDGNLTTQLKKEILLNNIYGVDIDTQAVEVTKLSLLLKCMEGETGSSINAVMRFGERVLPTLDNNIKSGNSLVDMDYYGEEIDFGEEKNVKPFNWQNAFPEVFQLKRINPAQDLRNQVEKVKKLEQDSKDLIDKYIADEPKGEYRSTKGFDVVIGNPPYGALFCEHEISYFKNRYQTAVWRGESYLIFIERAIKLLKEGGLLGVIIPDTLLNLGFTQPTRELLLRNSKLTEVIGLPSNVFSGATVDTIILITEKKDYTHEFHHSNIWIKTFGKKQTIAAIKDAPKEFFTSSKNWHEQGSFNLQTDNNEKRIIELIELKKQSVTDIAEIFYGIKAYQVGKGKPPQSKKIRDEKPFTNKQQLKKSWLPFFDGKDIGRYQLLWNNNNWIEYGPWLAEPRNPSIFEGEKILVRKITGKTLIATYVPETSYCNTLLFVLKLKNKDYSYKAILGILNSDLIGWYFRKKFQIGDDDTFPQIMIRDILKFPIPAIEEKENAQIVQLVETILQLHKEKQQTSTPDKLSQLEARIEYTDDKIKQLVFDLYGLSEEERRIVEGG